MNEMPLSELFEAVRSGTINGIKESVARTGNSSPKVLTTAWAMISVALKILEYDKYEIPKALAVFFLPYCGRDLAHAAVDDAYDDDYRRNKEET